MSNKTINEQWMEDPEFERLMAQEDFIMEVTESFCDILQDENVKKNKLAVMLGKTKGYISQILGGGRNLTLRTMADIAFVLGYEIEIKFVKKAKSTRKDTFNFPWDVGKKERVHVGACDTPIGNCFASDDYISLPQQLPRIAS
ncbi:hypothetical protein Dvar_11380 [Desulfosarcina variabilis str. Montpellier]|uniref:helix-turn-helix domain-containing protein n=1 Tax=Desulfosarcina variabilis TaxID=2300 RepID=UPI003AFAF011